MQQALLKGIAQSGLPVHQHGVVNPLGYPRIFYPLMEEFWAYQFISGYLISIKVDRIKRSGRYEVRLPSYADGMMLSQFTHFDTLTITQQEANCHFHRLYGA
jgi:hypothetical protein